MFHQRLSATWGHERGLSSRLPRSSLFVRLRAICRAKPSEREVLAPKAMVCSTPPTLCQSVYQVSRAMTAFGMGGVCALAIVGRTRQPSSFRTRAARATSCHAPSVVQSKKNSAVLRQVTKFLTPSLLFLCGSPSTPSPFSTPHDPNTALISGLQNGRVGLGNLPSLRAVKTITPKPALYGFQACVRRFSIYGNTRGRSPSSTFQRASRGRRARENFGSLGLAQHEIYLQFTHRTRPDLA